MLSTYESSSQFQLNNDVFISYNWDHKKFVMRFYEELKNNFKLKAWIDDFELKHTSLSLQLAKAITDSRVFVCFITKKYSESDNCKLEFFLAKRKKKPMIIIMLEPFDDNIAPEIEMVINTERRFNCYKNMDSVESFISSRDLGQAIKCIKDILGLEDNNNSTYRSIGSYIQNPNETDYKNFEKLEPTNQTEEYGSYNSYLYNSNQTDYEKDQKSKSIFSSPSFGLISHSIGNNLSPVKEKHHIVMIDGTYDGELKNSFRHGKGKLVYNTGVIYDGRWKNNLPEGFGVETYTNRDRFEGFFKNGVKDGKGKYFHPNGDYLDGNYKNGLVFGMAKYFYANGDIYEGNYFNGVRHGEGTYTFKNGEKNKQNYYNGTLMVAPILYFNIRN